MLIRFQMVSMLRLIKRSVVDFRAILASRSRATLGAVQNAIANVRQGLDVAIEQNTAPGGAPQVGALLVIVDDGTGYPSTDLLSSVATAVDAVRPVGTTFAVVPPQVLMVNVSLTAEFVSARLRRQGYRPYKTM